MEEKRATRRRNWRQVLGGLLLLAVGSGAAEAALPSVFLEELTWPELQAAQREGATTVILPIGGTEQNGPHMALGKHNARVRVLAGRIAAELGQTVVAPVLAYVPESPGHLRFPGTIDTPPEAFGALLAAAAQSLRRGGFLDIVLIGDSGDYQRQLQQLAEQLSREWKHKGGAPAARVHYVGVYYREAQAAFRQRLRELGHSEAEIGVHAGLLDTALLMATVPGMVRSEQLGEATRHSPANGVTGDPRAATAALGRQGADLVVRQSLEALRRALATPR